MMRSGLQGLAVLLFLGGPSFLCIPRQVRAELTATRLEAGNLTRLRVGGPDAVGGLGDWALSNGTLCAVVSDVAHESELSTTGGALADLGHCGRGDDQFVLLQTLMNLSAEGAVPGTEIEAQVDVREARIVVRGQREGVSVETAYTVDHEVPRRITIRSRFERVGPGERLFGFGDVVVLGDRSLSPFVIPRTASTGGGFQHPGVGGTGIRTLTRAIVPTDRIVLVGAEPLSPGISYAFQVSGAHLERGSKREHLPSFGLAYPSFVSLAAFVRPFWFGGGGGIGIPELAQTLFMDLASGSVLIYEREIHLGTRSDVASSLDAMIEPGQWVHGRVDDPEARIHVHGEGGAAVTQARPRSDGRFEFRLPPGSYLLRATALGGREVSRNFEVGSSSVDLEALALGVPTRVRLPRATPMRLIFMGVDGTPDPRIGDDLLGVRFGDQVPPTSLSGREVFLGGIEDDPSHVTLPPGRYRVLATRGLEFGVTETFLDAVPGKTVSLAVELPRREVSTPGWITADLHVHAAPSDDSAFPLRRRLASFLAHATEVLVATDHDHVTDYAPLIEELAIRDRIVSVVGVEVTSNVTNDVTRHSAGHLNAFPVPYRPDRYRKGAPRNEGQRIREIIHEVRSLGGTPLIQLNHPREPHGELEANAYFSHLLSGSPFDPAAPLTSDANRSLLEADPKTGVRDLDFDAMELMNGPSLTRYRQVRADWFSLLRQGEARTATGNSDTHMVAEIAAVPVNYLRHPTDLVTDFDETRLVQAVRRAELWATTGPLLDVFFEDVGVGGHFQGSSGILRVAIRAADWIPVSSLRVYLNGVLHEDRPAQVGDVAEIALEFSKDTFITVEVEGPAEGLYADVLPGYTPFAFTNPIFVEVGR